MSRHSDLMAGACQSRRAVHRQNSATGHCVGPEVMDSILRPDRSDSDGHGTPVAAIVAGDGLYSLENQG